MAIATVPAQHDPSDVLSVSHAAAEGLRTWFGTEFRLLDAGAERPRHRGLDRPWDDAAIARQVAGMTWREGPQFLPPLGPLLRLVLPIYVDEQQRALAIGTFVRHRAAADEDLDGAAVWLDMNEDETAAWVNAQPLWTCDALLRFGRLAIEKLAADRKLRRIERDVDNVTQNLVATYEQITFLYQVTERLARAESVESQVDSLLQRLVELLPARAIVGQFLPPDSCGDDGHDRPGMPALLMSGECPLEGHQLQRFIQEIALRVQDKPFVFNRDENTDTRRWTFPEVNQLIVVPLSAGGCLLGWVAAMNHGGDQWFGTVQARLLQCVATVLGMLSNNVLDDEPDERD